MNVQLLEVVQEFKSSVNERMLGFYKMKFNDREILISRNGNNLTALTHGLDDDELMAIRDEVSSAMLSVLNSK